MYERVPTCGAGDVSGVGVPHAVLADAGGLGIPHKEKHVSRLHFEITAFNDAEFAVVRALTKYPVQVRMPQPEAPPGAGLGP